jgi:hypothetical protein
VISSSTTTTSSLSSSTRAPLSPLSAVITSSPVSVKKFKEVRDSIKKEQERDQERQQQQQLEEEEEENIHERRINTDEEKKDDRIRAMSALVAAETEHLDTLAALQRLNGRAEQELNSIPPTPRIVKQYERPVDGNSLTRLESGPAQHPQVVGPSRTAVGSPRGRYSDRFRDALPPPFVGASVAATIHLGGGGGESEAPSPASTPPRQNAAKSALSSSRAMPTSPLSRREMKILAEEVALHQQSGATGGGGRGGGGGLVFIGAHNGGLNEKEKDENVENVEGGEDDELEGGELE